MSDKDKKSRPNNSVRDSDTVGGLAKRELLGSEEFKRSKVGWFTGASAIKRSLGYVPSTFSESSGRVGGLISSLFSSDSQTPAIDEGGTARERFKESMRLHMVGRDRLKGMIRNTKKNFDVLLICFVLGGALGVASIFLFPPSISFGYFPRFIPIPLLGALLFKNAYSNWMFRNQILAGPLDFIRSGDCWPKK